MHDSTFDAPMWRHWQPDVNTQRRLQCAGWRVTPQQRAVLTALHACDECFSDADALHRATMRSSHRVTLALAYRILGQFVRVQIAQSTQVGSRALYWLVGASGAQPQFVCSG